MVNVNKASLFTATHASYDLTEILRGILHGYKYQKKYAICGMLSQTYAHETPNFDLSQTRCSLAVPLSSERFFIGGLTRVIYWHKPSHVLLIGLFLPESMIFRVQKNIQVGLKFKQRQENVKNSFVFLKNIP